MLGRLHMAINDCIDACTTLSDMSLRRREPSCLPAYIRQAPGEIKLTALSWGWLWRSKDILVSCGPSEDALLKDTDSSQST